MGRIECLILYSLIESAKANGIDPYKYLKYIFEKFPYVKIPEDIFNLLPMNIDKPDFKNKWIMLT